MILIRNNVDKVDLVAHIAILLKKRGSVYTWRVPYLYLLEELVRIRRLPRRP